MSYGQKIFKLVWRCHQILSGFLAKGHLSRLSQSRLSANNKGDEMIPGVVHRSPGIALQLRKTRKSSARRPSMKAVQPVIVLNGVPYLQMMSVGSHRTSGREKERKKERKKEGFTNTCCPWNHGLRQ